MQKSRRRYELRVYLGRETYHRVSQESASRSLSLSRLVRTCLEEYFTLRDELASSLGIDQGGPQNRPHPTILHSLLSEVEHHLQVTLQSHGGELAGIRAELRRLLIMIDQHYLGMMVHLREPPEPERKTRLPSAARRHQSWRNAVAQTARESPPPGETHPPARPDPPSQQ